MRVEAEQSNASSAMERLRRGGLTYIDFAFENPDYYELMFNMPEPRNFMERQKDSASPDYAMRSYEFLKKSIQMCKDEGYLKDIDVDTGAFALWSLVHGVVSLIIRKRVPYPQAPSRRLAAEVIDFFGKLVISERFASEVKESLRFADGDRF